jgi:hypothetical protein
LSRDFRPGCRNRLFFTGSKGLIKSHSRSSKIGLAISVAPFPRSLPSREFSNPLLIYTFLNPFC